MPWETFTAIFSTTLAGGVVSGTLVRALILGRAIGQRRTKNRFETGRFPSISLGRLFSVTEQKGANLPVV